MKLPRLAYVLLLFPCISLLSSCSDDDSETAQENTIVNANVDDLEIEEENTINVSNLTERFIFDENIVIENSYSTSACESIPCDTEDESLVNVFVNAVPDDNYFYLSDDDESELNLECQLDKGRRIEFKQISNGSLESFAKIEFEAIYYDIPSKGVTIAQVHNRGGNSNKPFFRLVLRENGLETVIRKDPEVDSDDTNFQKNDFSFNGDGNYDLSSLKIIIEKSKGSVHISVAQNNELIIEESYMPNETTDWVKDNGIANGFYLKAGLYNDDGPHIKNLVAGYSTVIFESND